MSPEQDLWRLRRSSSFVFSWVILCLPGVHRKWHKLRCVFVKEKKHADVSEEHKWERDDLMLLFPLKHIWSLSEWQQAGWEGLSSFINSSYDFLRSPKPSLAVRLAGRGSHIQEDSQRGWLILKALSCQEDLYSADRGNVFCQAFEIQMISSTLCPTDGFESSHKKRATEMGPTRAEGEQKSKNQLHAKNSWQCQTKKMQISNQRATWLKLSKVLKCIETWLFLYPYCHF